MFKSKSFFIGRIGDDPDADIIQDALTKKSVEISCMPRNVSVPSGKAFIFLEPNGSNSIVIVQGANIEGWLSDKNSNRFLSNRECEIIAQSSCLMLQREIPDEVNVEAARVAKEHRVPVLLDVGGKDTPIDSNLAPLVDIIWPNETELSNICGGVPTNTDDDIFKAAKMLRDQGMKDVLVTIGEKGSMMIPHENPENVTRGKCYRVDNVIDTTGAGDCFRAAFATSRFCDRRDVKESLQFASAASALLVQRLGAMSAPTRDEINHFLSSSSSSLS
jgi:ribokinase